MELPEQGTYALAEPANVPAEEARADKAEPKPRPRGRKKQAPTASPARR